MNGEKPQDIPIVKSANVFTFDWRALQRWGLKESDLPSGSMVLHRQATIWELYRRTSWVALFWCCSNRCSFLDWCGSGRGSEGQKLN